ncbi:tetratricopeptide repeat-containing protein [Cardiosporidium cionae]|uniref:Tetratricopeptide repeat-containing protein n=1 Tax=Cardiosporidium cionae TaxID=476202 RepID=A0ABQ7JCH4_9APIC|nr:tetratricopeptide repeat-containing protein [Cardiosporidium cionae]|eukprot:KAF8821659.1 tetratricopeptide repeat-containing protein [Cardiosporidium cionae]
MVPLGLISTGNFSSRGKWPLQFYSLTEKVELREPAQISSSAKCSAVNPVIKHKHDSNIEISLSPRVIPLENKTGRGCFIRMNISHINEGFTDIALWIAGRKRNWKDCISCRSTCSTLGCFIVDRIQEIGKVERTILFNPLKAHCVQFLPWADVVRGWICRWDRRNRAYFVQLVGIEIYDDNSVHLERIESMNKLFALYDIEGIHPSNMAASSSHVDEETLVKPSSRAPFFTSNLSESSWSYSTDSFDRHDKSNCEKGWEAQNGLIGVLPLEEISTLENPGGRFPLVGGIAAGTPVRARVISSLNTRTNFEDMGADALLTLNEGNRASLGNPGFSQEMQTRFVMPAIAKPLGFKSYSRRNTIDSGEYTKNSGHPICHSSPRYSSFDSLLYDGWMVSSQIQVDPRFSNPQSLFTKLKCLDFYLTHHKNLSLIESPWANKRGELEAIKSIGIWLTNRQSREWADQRVVEGVKLARNSQFDTAIEYYNAALQLCEAHVDALIARGAARANQLKFKEALQDFDKALQIDPCQSNGILYRNITLSRLHDKGESKIPEGKSSDVIGTVASKVPAVEDLRIPLKKMKVDHNVNAVISQPLKHYDLILSSDPDDSANEAASVGSLSSLSQEKNSRRKRRQHRSGHRRSVARSQHTRKHNRKNYSGENESMRNSASSIFKVKSSSHHASKQRHSKKKERHERKRTERNHKKKHKK